MYNFTVPMGLMDYLPVLFFGITAVILLRDLHSRMTPGVYALLSAGSVNVFLAGFCKATWKLLYAANICDFVVLEKMFLPVNSLGLLFVGISLILMLCAKRKTPLLSVAPVAFTGSLPFIMMMVLGLGGMCVSLSIAAARMKRWLAVILLILSFVCAMGMGFMSGQDSSLAWVNWAEQSINCVSQGLLLWAVWILHRHGLKNIA